MAETNPLKKVRSDFIFLNEIGEGSFSLVYSVEEKKSGLKFAIKECDKFQILREKKAKYIHLEKRILSEILKDNPFIVRLAYTFHDEANLYFCLTYCPNGDLLAYSTKYAKFFRENLFYTQFYSAEILSAIEYMQSKNVIHRDLKPENILVDERRHIKITDFGSARVIEPDDEVDNEVEKLNNQLENLNVVDSSSETEESQQPPQPQTTARTARIKRSNSFVGTAQFVAPEILKSERVHRATDLWGLGCVIFQLITGKHLFTGSHDYDIFQKVINVRYTLPDSLQPIAKDLVEKLVILEPSNRLGSKEKGGLEKLKDHELFRVINWTNLNEQQPPNPTNDDNVNNF